MIESDFVEAFLNIALLMQVILILASTVRVIIGPDPADRLQAIDTITNILIGVIVVLALLENSVYIIDLAIALAAFAFVSTTSISRYMSEGRMF